MEELDDRMEGMLKRLFFLFFLLTPLFVRSFFCFIFLFYSLVLSLETESGQIFGEVQYRKVEMGSVGMIVEPPRQQLRIRVPRAVFTLQPVLFTLSIGQCQESLFM